MFYNRKISSLIWLVVVLLVPSFLLIGASYVVTDLDFRRKINARVNNTEYLGREGVILQDKNNNCGAAALKMVFDHFEIPSRLIEIENQIGLTDHGSSMLALKEMAKLKGLRAEGWRYTVEDFLKAPKPSIVFIHGDHFAVVDSVANDGSIIVRDPALGKLKIKKEKFQEFWIGETLVFEQVSSRSKQIKRLPR